MLIRVISMFFHGNAVHLSYGMHTETVPGQSTLKAQWATLKQSAASVCLRQARDYAWHILHSQADTCSLLLFLFIPTLITNVNFIKVSTQISMSSQNITRLACKCVIHKDSRRRRHILHPTGFFF